jgi:hypothetical protein
MAVKITVIFIIVAFFVRDINFEIRLPEGSLPVGRQAIKI